MEILRRQLDFLRRTPLHPQWFVADEQAARQQSLRQLSGSILDIGCADRSIARELPQGCRYIGLDYYTTAKSIYHSVPDLYADACALPLNDGSVDGVLLFEVLEHVRDPDAAIAEIARVLRPGGRLLLSVPFLYPIHDAPHDFHRFTRYALEQLMHRHGFAVESIRPRLKSLEVAALLNGLALGDAAKLILECHPWAFLALPPIALMILASNVSAWLLARLLPGSDFMPGGYEVAAVRLA